MPSLSTVPAAAPFAGATATASAAGSQLYRRVWRWHFYAGLVCLPFILSLAITGALYLFHKQIDDIVYADLLLRPAAAQAGPQAQLSPEALMAAARRAVPGRPKALTVADDPRHSAQVDIVDAQGVTLQVFLDPVSGAVQGSLPEADRVMGLIKRLHSLSVAGDAGKVVIEIVAGWIIVLIVSGAYLWWPRGRTSGVVSIRPGASGRAWWRDLHAVTGAFAAVVVLFLALTGMPWSVVWGQNVNRWLTDHELGVPKGMFKNVPKSALPATVIGDLPWTQQQLPLPASDDPHAEHRAAAARAQGKGYLALDNPAAVRPSAIVASLAALGLKSGYRLNLPRDARGVYSMVRSPGQLGGQRVIHFDQYSGRVLVDLSSAQIGPVGRVTEWGVSVHQGAEYGLPNQLLMLAGCLALITLCVSGVVIWWKRRPAGKLGAPARRHDARLARGVLAIAATLGLLFPLLGLSMLAACAIDFLAGRMRPAAID